MRNLLILCFSLLMMNLLGGGPLSPPIPFNDWGSCPFECCTYRSWSVVGPYTLLKAPARNSQVIGRYTRKKRILALTGVVITVKAGKINILKPMTLGGDNGIQLVPGEIVYSLHYQGEGFSTFWVNGNKVDGEEIDPRLVANDKQTDYRVIFEAMDEWWAKIKAPDGKIGWVLVGEQFGDMDACG